MQSGNTKFVWELLNTVPDPEIPVISVVELGVIREVKFENNSYTISITPTYSGCPAVKTFMDDIKTCLLENSIENFELKNPNWESESAKIFARKKRLGIKYSNNLEKDLAKMARAGFNYKISKNILNLD